MQQLLLTVREAGLKFYLSNSEVDSKMVKKFEKLGFPDIWVDVPIKGANKISQNNNGFYELGESDCEKIMLVSPTSNGKYLIEYNENENCLILLLHGEFDAGNYFPDDLDWLQEADVKEGYISSIRPTNDKGKEIRKPKDEWGISAPIEALSIRENYESLVYQRVSFEARIIEN